MTRTAAIFALSCTLALTGCSLGLSPRPDYSRYFVLSPNPGAGASAAMQASNTDALVIGLGPIKMPAYLDRQEVVTRVGPNRLNFSSTDQWAEPLDSNFSHVLAQDLSAHLGTQLITFFPWYRTTHIDYQVRIDVYSFEGDSTGSVTLSAHWQVLDGTGKLLYAADSNLTEAMQTDEKATMAAAMSRTISRLSEQIASQIRSYPPTSGPRHARAHNAARNA